MRTGKLAGVILAALIAAAMMRIPVYAAPAAAGGIQTEEQDETGVSLDYSEIDAALGKLGEDSNVSFSELVAGMVSGNMEISVGTILNYISDKIFSELALNQAMMFQIIGIALIGARFTNFSAAFAKKYVAETGFYLTYMIVFALLAASFLSALTIAQDVTGQLIGLMKVIIPAFCMALTLSLGITTSGAFYEVMMIAVIVIDWLIANFIISFIKIYVVLSLVNHMTKEDYLSKMADLLHVIISWTLKTIMAVTLGINLIQGLVLPAFDSIKNGLFAKVGSVIPGLGGAFSMAAKAAIGSGVLLKNAVGTAGVVVLCIVCAVPLLKLLLIVLMYKLMEAVLQPVSDERLTACVHDAGEGILLLFKSAGTVILLFVLSLAMITSSSNMMMSV